MSPIPQIHSHQKYTRDIKHMPTHTHTHTHTQKQKHMHNGSAKYPRPIGADFENFHGVGGGFRVLVQAQIGHRAVVEVGRICGVGFDSLHNSHKQC